MTAAQRKALENVVARSGIVSAGIPLPERMARSLVEGGLAEWAPPFWPYPKPVFAVRVTGRGRAELIHT